MDVWKARLARLFFIAVPAVGFGFSVGVLLHPYMGMVIGFGMCIFGYDVTQPVASRDEKERCGKE